MEPISHINHISHTYVLLLFGLTLYLHRKSTWTNTCTKHAQNKSLYKMHSAYLLPKVFNISNFSVSIISIADDRCNNTALFRLIACETLNKTIKLVVLLECHSKSVYRFVVTRDFSQNRKIIISLYIRGVVIYCTGTGMIEIRTCILFYPLISVTGWRLEMRLQKTC